MKTLYIDRTSKILIIIATFAIISAIALPLISSKIEAMNLITTADNMVDQPISDTKTEEKPAEKSEAKAIKENSIILIPSAKVKPASVPKATQI